MALGAVLVIPERMRLQALITRLSSGDGQAGRTGHVPWLACADSVSRAAQHATVVEPVMVTELVI
jgi:hypothetical protein